MVTPAHADAAAVSAAMCDLAMLVERLPAVLGASADPGPRPGCSRAQELGHCIDSALNNLQRLIRLRSGPLDGFPGYDPDAWVAASAYESRPWDELVDEWRLLNRHLVHAARQLPPEALARRWQTTDTSQTLAFILVDYVAHLRGHLVHLLEPGMLPPEAA